MIQKLGTIRTYFKEDVTAALGLALVVLPIALGIAIASGVPPMAGVISAVIGGIVATFFRSSQITINGPSAGLITVMLSGVIVLGEGEPLVGFQYILAATVVAGIGQMILGLLRFGEIADITPAAAINGMLAAVGLTIIGTQGHVIFGHSTQSDNAYESLQQLQYSIQNLNPIITLIGGIATIVLITYNKVNIKVAQYLPAPIWIILFTIPIVYYFNFFETHYVPMFGTAFDVGPSYLVDIPVEITSYMFDPNFSKIGELHFWGVSLSILIVSTIETLVSARVVDKLDPLERHTNLNKELFAVGLSSIISGCLGGLPVITAIPVHNGAKTKWSNLYYGLILGFFVLLMAPLIRLIPLAALAVLLVYTGYKLATLKIWKDTYRKGDDQFLIFLTTLLATLVYDLLIGLVVGATITLFIHYVKSNLGRKQFVHYLINPSIDTTRTENTHELYIKLKGIVNFVNIPKLKRVLRDSAKEEKHIIVDMSHARLIDYTVLEYLHDDAPRYDLMNVQFEIVGLGAHDASSRHPNATRILPEDKKPQLNQRQSALKVLCEENNGTFWPEVRWDFHQFKDFEFFKTRTIEYTFNTAKGHYKMFFEWETCDITFEEGGLFSNQERYTSVLALHLPFNAPQFVLQREALLDKIGVKLALRDEDINLEGYPDFSEKFLLEGNNPAEVRKFFNDSLVRYLNNNPNYHMECNGAMLLIFREMRFATPTAMTRIHEFSHELAEILLESWKAQPLDLEAML
ncbi:SulP family inorganic anion transporter [Aureispira anguillae]|uniref:SulP family inorganic anion transporter n=1 Tax=Aureispira anguillae TaxID=2864201 RepID=A0A915YB19_9BACT|nr:SulP family inorganic anion transporter [Aureispira anguillae]BDS09788.1 SulP family inorganic anion transporter [Aureispira anguillae]